jgi:hypothetical protein
MNGMVEIFGDIKEGELVAADANEELQDNSRVEAIAIAPTVKEKALRKEE